MICPIAQAGHTEGNDYLTCTLVAWRYILSENKYTMTDAEVRVKMVSEVLLRLSLFVLSFQKLLE